jgi:hypothetical protein
MRGPKAGPRRQRCNGNGSKAYSRITSSGQLAHWQRVTDLRDQAGQPITVTGHQFRHTLGSGTPTQAQLAVQHDTLGTPGQQRRGRDRPRSGGSWVPRVLGTRPVTWRRHGLPG